jgi:DNA-binding transcriptional regulator PaaX
MGGRVPEERWNRPWDGKWRIILFDIAEEDRMLRNQLRRQLKAANFGCLQRSIWIAPDPLDSLAKSLKESVATPGTMAFFEGVPCGGESPAEVVSSAWNFAAINKAHADHQALLDLLPCSPGDTSREHLLAWARDERESWAICMQRDPLLPRVLWPEGYQGEITWVKRTATLRRAATLANTLRDIKLCDRPF